MILIFKEFYPNIHQTAWVAPSADLIGNITIGDNGNWFSDGKDTGIPATPVVDEQLDNISLQLQQHNKILEKQTLINNQLDNKIQTNLQNINKNIDEIDKIKREIITFVPISNEFINNLFN